MHIYLVNVVAIAIWGGYHSSLNFCIGLISVIVIFFGALAISNQEITIPDLLAYIMYISNLASPIKSLINFTEQYQQGITGFERFLEIMDIQPDIKDAQNAVELKAVEGHIRFENVAFRYNDKSDYVLNDINLDVAAGEYIALVGTSGAGKTTICSLLPRFYEVTSGNIYIDDMNLQTITQSSLRKNIGIVQQDVYLFTGTIMDNIRYGMLEASESDVIEAAKKANAHEFIMSLPDGYDTDCGQRGVKLSGGQKQRLSIARVFLKNPAILIFDEATSALDNESEKIVQDSLEKLAHNRTTFVIAHRLSTIKNAKKICVVEEGTIVELGTHEDLLNQNGKYAAFYNLQFK